MPFLQTMPFMHVGHSVLEVRLSSCKLPLSAYLALFMALCRFKISWRYSKLQNLWKFSRFLFDMSPGDLWYYFQSRWICRVGPQPQDPADWKLKWKHYGGRSLNHHQFKNPSGDLGRNIILKIKEMKMDEILASFWSPLILIPILLLIISRILMTATLSQYEPLDQASPLRLTAPSPPSFPLILLLST